ncbi:MAG TPA: hypothetical protein VHN77_04270 [Phycisphaerales bacterium]|nr:hypothetical protein [Phycisphaerales bacterium]
MRTPALLVVAAGLAFSTLDHTPFVVSAMAQPAKAGNTELPVRSITLYRSGVASFERRGSVDNDASVVLRFRTEQINDILKSLVVLDHSGGTIAGVSYPSQEPLERRLASLGVDITDDPSAREILARLRGTPVRVQTQEASYEGTVLNVEERPTIYQPKGDGAVNQHQLPWINLITKAGVRAVNLTEVIGFEVLDARLAEDLRQALAAIAEQRSDQFKAVELDLRGDGTRDVSVAYVHEAPVWKTSYRLVLDAEAGSKESPFLQGWAIVENTTDEDWRDVGLSLASGQPSAFRMNLYEPLFQERIEVAVPVPLAVAPRAYEEQYGGSGQSPFREGNAPADRDERRLAKSITMPGRPGSPMPAMAEADAAGYRMANRAAMLASAPVAAAAVETGDIFFYRMAQPISIGRQRSAMLPIVGQEIQGRRVSIRTPGDTGIHPRLGVEITNTSGLELIAGPVAVYEGDVYAGDAQVGDTGKGDVRLLSYSMDSDVKVTIDTQYQARTSRVRIVKGLLELMGVSLSTAEYHIESADEDAPRTLILEHPKVEGATLTEPAAPASQTPTQYRFEVVLKARETKSLKVVQSLTTFNSLSVLDTGEDAFARYSVEGASVSKAVREAFQKAHALRGGVLDAQKRVAEIEQEQSEIRAEQARIRENLNTIDRSGELATRLMRKLSDQETRMENLFESLKGARESVKAAQAALNAYISDLNVD